MADDEQSDPFTLNLDPALGRAHVLEIADAIDAFDPAPVADRLAQAGLGWLRAMGAQARLIVMAEDAGMADAAAPNRRLFFELVMTIGWLHEDGDATVDAIIRKAQNAANKFFESNGDMTDRQREDREMLNSVQTGDDKSKDNRAAVKTMADYVAGGDGQYMTWWEETRFSHASMDLAIAYAPAQEDGTLGLGRPHAIDSFNTLQLSLLLAVSYVARVLRERGDLEVADRLMATWFETLEPARKKAAASE